MKRRKNPNEGINPLLILSAAVVVAALARQTEASLTPASEELEQDIHKKVVPIQDRLAPVSSDQPPSMPPLTVIPQPSYYPPSYLSVAQPPAPVQASVQAPVQAQASETMVDLRNLNPHQGVVPGQQIIPLPAVPVKSFTHETDVFTAPVPAGTQQYAARKVEISRLSGFYGIHPNGDFGNRLPDDVGGANRSISRKIKRRF